MVDCWDEAGDMSQTHLVVHQTFATERRRGRKRKTQAEKTRDNGEDEDDVFL
jgi:hypothetical protein